jgi:hypothetical protein
VSREKQGQKEEEGKLELASERYLVGYCLGEKWEIIRGLSRFLANWWSCSLRRRMMLHPRVKKLTSFRNWS